MSNEIELLKSGANKHTGVPAVIVDQSADPAIEDNRIARNAMHNTLKTGLELLDHAALLAIDADDPKAYTAATRVMDSLARAAASLAALHETEVGKRASADNKKSTNFEGPRTIGEKTTFLGSPSDLLRMIEKETSKEED